MADPQIEPFAEQLLDWNQIANAPFDQRTDRLIAFSQAVSLKRIADALDRMASRQSGGTGFQPYCRYETTTGGKGGDT